MSRDDDCGQDIAKARMIQMVEANCDAIAHNLRAGDIALCGAFAWMIRLLNEDKRDELRFALEYMRTYYSSRS